MVDTTREIYLQPMEGDDVGFIDLVENIINGLIVQHDIDEISLVKIKNWFDHKWLNFSGKAIIHTEETLNPDKVALQESWKSKITVPPFNPNRVLSEIYFIRRGTDNKSFEKLLHNHQISTANQNNRINLKSDNGLFIWYSSNTVANTQGSLMAYIVNNTKVDSWYLILEDKRPWKITQLKGIKREELNKIINNER